VVCISLYARFILLGLGSQKFSIRALANTSIVLSASLVIPYFSAKPKSLIHIFALL